MSHTHLRYHQGVEHTQHPTEETNHMSDENTTPADLAQQAADKAQQAQHDTEQGNYTQAGEHLGEAQANEADEAVDGPDPCLVDTSDSDRVGSGKGNLPPCLGRFIRISSSATQSRCTRTIHISRSRPQPKI